MHEDALGTRKFYSQAVQNGKVFNLVLKVVSV